MPRGQGVRDETVQGCTAATASSVASGIASNIASGAQWRRARLECGLALHRLGVERGDGGELGLQLHLHRDRLAVERLGALGTLNRFLPTRDAGTRTRTQLASGARRGGRTHGADGPRIFRRERAAGSTT
eukprot:5267168-Pleurochrysis_carterae.AAC.4